MLHTSTFPRGMLLRQRLSTSPTHEHSSRTCVEIFLNPCLHMSAYLNRQSWATSYTRCHMPGAASPVLKAIGSGHHAPEKTELHQTKRAQFIHLSSMKNPMSPTSCRGSEASASGPTAGIRQLPDSFPQIFEPSHWQRGCYCGSCQAAGCHLSCQKQRGTELPAS